MKKLIITFIMVIALVLMLQVAVSADEMSYYCDAQITFTDNTTVTAYFAISTSQKSISRDSIYKTTNTSDGTYSWGDVKIVDMRGSTVIGGVTPTNFRGTECSKQAVNCERFYFPSCIKEVLDSTFTSGWKKLEYVYLNKEITIIKNTSFQGSPIVTVEIEEGSMLKTIENSAFQSCSKLTSINLPEGLESIGRNGFYQSGLSGTFRVPDSVTYLAPGAFLSTKIETLILGAGSLEIGYNFAGTFNSIDNAYLKNVYMPSETTFEANSSKYFFKCANPVNFYIVGDDCDTLVATLKSHSTGNYITFIDASEATDSTGAGYGIIHTGYNKCDAFYNGNHVERLEEGEADTNPCVITFCTVCEIENKYVGSDDTHTFAIEYSYENGYLAEGKKVSVILGFNTKSEIFYENEFKALGAEVRVTTVDGSYGAKGFVTTVMPEIDYSYVYTCGPEPMLKAVYNTAKTSGQFSFEERMGCGFGACMGCSCKTLYGNKRICKDGPVLRKEEIIWEK